MSWEGIKDYGFGRRPREVDDAYRAKSHGERTWTKQKCLDELNDLLDILKRELKDANKIETDKKKLKFEVMRDTNVLMNRILEFMK